MRLPNHTRTRDDFLNALQFIMRLPPARHSTPSVVKRRNYIHYVNTTNYTEYAAKMLNYVFESERTVFPVI